LDKEPDNGASKERLAIYRARDARDYAEHDVMSMDEMTPIMAEGLAHYANDRPGGQIVKLLYAAPGFSLTYVWFKSGYPLPLHSHNSDCLYHIIGGSLKFGHEVLGVGDGFFIGKDVAYTYVAGPEGVEVLEFRNTDKFNIRFRSNNKTVWDKAAATLIAKQAAWSVEQPPRSAGGDSG
jgi:hypothetical protein